jgi:hypothetical protein
MVNSELQKDLPQINADSRGSENKTGRRGQILLFLIREISRVSAANSVLTIHDLRFTLFQVS